VVPQGPEVQEQTTEVAAADECETETVHSRPHRISWARLLKRVFDIDMHTCPNCGGGELKIIAAILERPVIAKILTHLGLSPDTNSPVDCLCLAKSPAAGRARPARLDPQPPPRGRAREVVQG
jgi:hypothetical protein